MFDLNQAIIEWRQQMSAGGIKNRLALDELESHLRDDVEQQMRSGSIASQAFEGAVQRIGQASLVGGEFEKVFGTTKVMKQAILTLAGIPNHYLSPTMNTSNSNIEPRWATYFKASAFLAPALGLWVVSAVYLIPKLQKICQDANFFSAPGTTVWNFTRVNIGTTLFVKENSVILFVAALLVLGLLEWRSRHWPRYRRATIGLGVFLLNSLVLLSVFMMVVTAVVAAPALLHSGH